MGVTCLVADENFDATLEKKMKRYVFLPIPSSKEEQIKYVNQKLKPNIEITNEAIELGKMLWFDERLSANQTISCNTCHDLNNYGVDGLQTPYGIENKINPYTVNSPTVYNAIFNRLQFWNGRAATLMDQAAEPLLSDYEMGNTKQGVVDTIKSIPGYVEMFNKMAPDKEITFELIAESLAIFESTLITPSRFDEFLNGDKSALNKEEKEGFYLFLDYGCAGCHNDRNLGGSMNLFEVMGKYDKRDIGALQKDENGKTKVPTLRNISHTAPYFHNGAVGTLQEAVKTMGEVQLGIKIDELSALKIIKFLKTLDSRPKFIAAPVLPK